MRERAQVVDAGRLPAAELGVLRLIAPGDERGEAAGLVLQLAQPEQVLEPLLDRLDRAVHHRRRRAQPARCAWRITSSHSSAVALP